MTEIEPWFLYSTESEPTHIAQPNESKTYCGVSLDEYRPQGRVTDPSAFHTRDSFCTDCLYEILGANAVSMVEEHSSEI